MVRNQLVSISVKTYNSSKYVIETLDSIREQTYQNIELIISDDCSSDNTVDVCKEWVSQNKSRFVDVQIIESPINTGIPANCNRALNACHGEWYKGIAGDDLLLPDAIEKYVDYVQTHEDVQLVFAKMYEFWVDRGQHQEKPFGDVSRSSIDFFNNQSAHDQYLSFLKDEVGCGGSPTLFARKDLMVKYPFNEQYKGFEDIPQYIKLTRNGVHLNCMDEFTVMYRRGDSLTSSKKRFFSPVLWDSKHQFFWNELKEMLLEENLCDIYNKKRLELLKIDLLDCLTHNKPTFLNRVKCVLLSKIIRRLSFS